MYAIPQIIIKRPPEWLGAIRGPQRLVVKGCGIPKGLNKDLRDGNWVCVRARAVGGWVRCVALVIGAVEVHAIPARRESYGCHNAICAGGVWELGGPGISSPRVFQACKEKQRVLLKLGRSFEGRVANRHAESGCEGSYTAVSQIVYSLATVRSVESKPVANGVDALKGPVLRSEEEHSGPVVGKVIEWCTGGACRGARYIVDTSIHSDVKGVSAGNLVKVR